MPGLGEQLHGGLEEVQVQPCTVIDSAQTPIGCLRVISIIADQAAYYIPILLFYMATIILLVGTRPREGDLLITAIIVKAPVNELAAVVRVYAQYREGKMLSHPVYRLPYLLLPFAPHWQTFRPATSNIYGTECVQVEALRALAAVSYQVCLYKSRLVLLPVGKRPDGYTALKQASRPGSGR